MICTFHRRYLGDKIKEGEVGQEVSMRHLRFLLKVLVENRERKKYFGRPLVVFQGYY
jgi:hypothetical protein